MKGECIVTNGLVTLKIPDICKEMRGILQFKIQHPFSIDGPEIEIKIREEDKKSTKISKEDLEIKVNQSKIEIVENTEMLLEVVIVAGNKNMYLPPKWTLNDLPLVNKNSKVTTETKRCKLSIPSCKVKDSGKYKCTFAPGKGNTSEPVSAEFTVTVIDPKKTKLDSKPKEVISPIIKVKSSVVEVDEYDDLIIEVDLLGMVNEDPRWYFNKNLLSKSDNIDVVYKSDTKKAQLVVKKCEKVHEGEYTCSVTNPGNSTEESVIIVVRVVKKQVSGFLDCDIQEIDLKTGEILKLEMKAVGIDEKALKGGNWFLNNKVMDIKKVKGEFTVLKDKITLRIPNVTNDIEGSLRFKITTPLSLSSPEIDIKIRNKDSTKVTQLATRDLKIKELKSHFTVEESDEILLEIDIQSGNITLYESPKWTLNGVAIDNRTCKTTLDSRTCKLLLPSCKAKDCGKYECTFLPKKASKLETVVACFFVKMKDVSVKMLVANKKIDALEDDSVTLCVETEGLMETDIRWTILEDSNRLESKSISERVLKKFNHNLALLLLDKLVREDSGTYVCKGSVNGELRSEAVMSLTVHEKKECKKECLGKFEMEVYSVKEFEKLTLRVGFTCDKVHTGVVWYLNSKVLDIGGEIVVEKNLVELIIERCTTDKAGLYICTVEHEDSSTSSATTKVEIVDIIEKRTIKVVEGEDIRLTINLEEELECYDFQWLKNGVIVGQSSGFIETREKNTVSFIKKRSTIDDTGNYRFSSLLQVVEFVVTVEERYNQEIGDKMSLICDQKEIVAKESEPLIISIEVDKCQPAIVQWFLNEKTFGECQELDGQFIDLYVESPESKVHSGVFKCEVTDSCNRVSRAEINVRFESEEDNNERRVDEVIDLLSCTVEEVDLLEGSQLQVSIASRDCTDMCQDINWYKDDCALDKGDPRLTLVVQPYNYNLLLGNVHISDSGVYSLNIDGHVSTVLVRVRQRRSSEVHVTKPFVSQAIPKTKIKMKEIKLESEPQVVKFEYEIEECGPTKVVWYFEDEQIETDNSEFIQWSCDNYFALTIPVASQRHCGRYTIKVANEMGYVKDDARLYMLEKTKITSFSQAAPENIEESCCIAPLFTKKLKSVDLSSGDTLRLSCRMMSEPEPKILWTKDGESLEPKNSNRKMKILNNFPNYDLTIADVSTKDIGQYCCMASNFLGFDTTVAFVTIDGCDFDDEEGSNGWSKESLVVSKPLTLPILKIISTNQTEIVLAWTDVVTSNMSKVSYTIEKQKFNKSTQWRSIKKDLSELSYKIPTNELPLTEIHRLRCVATTESGHQTVSNTIIIDNRLCPPTIPVVKPTIVFRDASCITITWQRGKCHELTSEESFGKVFYCLEMKDNPKNDWKVVDNKILKSEYLMSLEPDVSYMFRVSAVTDSGTSAPTPSIVTRVDKMKLTPEFNTEPPWLHLQGQPCLKWRQAYVPEYCDSCVAGILPLYKVEYRTGRLSTWEVYRDNIVQNQIFLDQDLINRARELRVSCENRFGQNGPSRSLKVPAKLAVRSDQDPRNELKLTSVMNVDNLKTVEIDFISPSGVGLKWEAWREEPNNRYMIQKKSSYSPDWIQLEPIVYGENYFLDLKLSENFCRELRILAIEGDDRRMVQGYNVVIVPSKEQLVPTSPSDIRVSTKVSEHELSWTGSNNHPLIDLPITYTVQCKLTNNIWITIGDLLHKCTFTNDKIGDYSVIFYRVLAVNAFGPSEHSKEVQVNTPLNVVLNEQIVKSIRYFVIDFERLDIKWQLSDVVFDNGFNIDDLSFCVEKKSTLEVGDWQIIGRCSGRCTVVVGFKFGEENLIRVQPYIDGEKMSPSRMIRIYLTRELLVPDMSFVKPEIISDSIKDYFIEWVEPSIESGFSPEALTMCSMSVLTTDLQYKVQYCTEWSRDSRRPLTKDFGTELWTKINDGVVENNIYWENPDPTQEYTFRVIPINQFGEGQPSRVTKLRPQITIPDFSFVRPNIDDQSSGSKKTHSDSILSWIAPRINPECYTPYSIDVQYRQRRGPPTEDWTTFKRNVKKSRVSINELDPTMDYELRIVPVTEFGSGNPSVIVKRHRRYDQERPTNDQSMDCSNQTYVKEIYVSLAHDVQLIFNRPYNVNKDDILWLKDDEVISPRDTERLKFFSTDRNNICLLISNVREEDIGTYSIQSPSIELVQSIRLIKADAPTFLNPPLNLSVNLHDYVQITFTIDSQPPPTVLWCKNWKKIYSSHRTNVVDDTENCRYSLVLSKCIKSDSGEYSVRAENVVGFAEVRVNLRVEDQPEMKIIQINEGDVSDRFYVVKQISRGTYSSCQLMAEKSTRREFIGKVFGTNNVDIGKMELESTKNIRHRNFVELIEAVLNPTESLILIYESFDGVFLVDHIANLSHWNEQQVQLIIQQLFQATYYLHSMGICHLDIQPSNISITGKLFDTVKVSGFSNVTKEDNLEIRRHQLAMCAFSAPELLKGEPLSLKCDVWSLGLLTLICFQGRLNMNLEMGPLDLDDGWGLLSDASCSFVVDCLRIDCQQRLSSTEALQHHWFTNKSIDYNASLDHLKDDIVKLMTYPEEMILSFSSDMQVAIKNSLIVPKPKLVVDSVQSSPSISQLSSRASSVSRDGINYERCDLANDPIADPALINGDDKENLQSIDDTYVPNSARELLFTVPLKDQTFSVTLAGRSTTQVTLTCQLALSASDAISISWYRNQELLTDGQKIKLEVLNEGFLSCTIDSPGDSDVGIYRCVARSRSLRAETSARLLVGDIPSTPGQPSVLFVNGNDILLQWTANLSSTDDIIYRVDFKEINSTEELMTKWKTIGYTVDNRYLLEGFFYPACVTRVVAQNKYGFSSYSVASSAFQNKSNIISVDKKDIVLNKQWTLETRQSKNSSSLHDLIKDIPSADITVEIIDQIYSSRTTTDRDVRILSLNDLHGTYPDFVVQRKMESSDKCPAIDLCLRLKYYHLPIIYGSVRELSTGVRYSIEEYVPGGDLISVLLARGLYSEFTVMTIARQLMETVQFLHSNNIIHTNINPSNILIARRTNQLYDIKLVGLHHCQTMGASQCGVATTHKVDHKMSTFQAPEFRYEGISKYESDIWSIGTLAFLLLSTQLPTIEDICPDSNVLCPIKNSNTLHLPTTHSHFRSPDLSLVRKFSKSALKFIYNSLKKNPSERGSADYWLAQSWFSQDLSTIAELQTREIKAHQLVEFMTSSF